MNARILILALVGIALLSTGAVAETTHEDNPEISDGLPLATDHEVTTTSADAGICVIGADSPCNQAPTDQNHTAICSNETHDCARPLPTTHNGDVIRPVCEPVSECARYSGVAEPVSEPHVENEPRDTTQPELDTPDDESDASQQDASVTEDTQPKDSLLSRFVSKVLGFFR